eukprot:13487297-Ditylum_brightwellii.AAC.1
MSALVSKLLKPDELITKDFTKHPILIKDEVETSVPHQQRQFKYDNNKTSNILFYLWLTNIASTFYSWAEEHKIELLTGGGREQAVNQIHNDDENEELAIFNSINQGQEEEKCHFCGTNHSTESCHKLINHVKAKHYFSKNPAIKKVLTETPSKRTYPKRNIYRNKYAYRNSKHVDKVEEDEISPPEEETEILDEEQEDKVSNYGDVVHIDKDRYIHGSDYDDYWEESFGSVMKIEELYGKG